MSMLGVDWRMLSDDAQLSLAERALRHAALLRDDGLDDPGIPAGHA